MKMTCACLAAAVALMSGSAPAQTAVDFAGVWKPAKPASGVAELRITEDKGRWVARYLAACTPTPCDWGTVPFQVLAQKPAGSGPSVGVAIWVRGTSTRFMTLKRGEDALLVEIHNIFSGPRDQPSFLTVQEMVRQARP